MGDAATNHPVTVLAPGDVGQSSFGANSSAAATGGGFVALDVGALSSLAGDAGPPGTPTAPPRTPSAAAAPPRTPVSPVREARAQRVATPAGHGGTRQNSFSFRCFQS